MRSSSGVLGSTVQFRATFFRIPALIVQIVASIVRLLLLLIDLAVSLISVPLLIPLLAVSFLGWLANSLDSRLGSGERSLQAPVWSATNGESPSTSGEPVGAVSTLRDNGRSR